MPATSCPRRTGLPQPYATGVPHALDSTPSRSHGYFAERRSPFPRRRKDNSNGSPPLSGTQGGSGVCKSPVPVLSPAAKEDFNIFLFPPSRGASLARAGQFTSCACRVIPRSQAPWALLTSDIRRRNERAVLLAQMLCIPGQVRRSGFPGLRQPIDPIVALQSAALHFRAAERTIQTNLLLFRYPQERGPGKPRVFPVLSPATKEDISIIFGRTCACRKFPDPGALGAVHQ